MKKLLSLMVVLVLCGFASAGVDVYITDAVGNSEITTMPSDTIELLLWYAGDAIISFDIDIDIVGPGYIANPSIAMLTAVGRNTEYDYCWIPGMNEGAEFELTSSADAPPGLTAGILNPLAIMTLHCDGQGDVIVNPINVSLYDPIWAWIDFPTMHGIIVHQIPEPVTIALFCLGGLILRKK